MVVTGSKSEDDSDSRLASRKYARSEAWFQSKIFRVLSWAVVTDIFVFTCSLVLFTVWYDQAQGDVAYLRIGKDLDRVNGRKGDSSFSSLLQV